MSRNQAKTEEAAGPLGHLVDPNSGPETELQASEQGLGQESIQEKLGGALEYER